MRKKLKQIEKTAGAEQIKKIKFIKKTYNDYLVDLHKTAAITKQNKDSISTSDAQQEILASVIKSRPKAEKLRAIVQDYVKLTDIKGSETSANASQTAKNVELTLIFVALLGVIAGVLLGYYIANSGISRPLKICVNSLKELANNNLEVKVVGDDRADEIGDIARTMEVFKENAVERQKADERERLELEKRNERAKEMERLTTEFDNHASDMMKALAASATELQATAQNMATTAEQTEKQSSAVAAASEQASANVQTVAASTEELTASISEISQQVTQSSSVANNAVKEANQTNKQMERLETAAHRIGEVITIISGIAEQTNLLALNATIEAARAGEAGKGFAVVASEVKNLANQTAKATTEISQQIVGIQDETRLAANAIDLIAGTIQDMSNVASSISAAAEEQSVAKNEISKNVEEAASGTQEVSQNIAGVNEGSQQTGEAADQVLRAARELSSQAENMHKTVITFITNVRSL